MIQLNKNKFPTYFIFGFFGFIFMFFWCFLLGWPITIPIKLENGMVYERDFILFSGLQNNIELSFDRHRERPDLELLMGGYSDSDHTLPINIEWSVLKGREVVKEEHTASKKASYWASDSIGRWLGSFQGTLLSTYKFKAKILTTSQDLNSCNPRITISTDQWDVEGIIGWAVICPFIYSCMVILFLIVKTNFLKKTR